jgi:hypothetical protein
MFHIKTTPIINNNPDDSTAAVTLEKNAEFRRCLVFLQLGQNLGVV